MIRWGMADAALLEILARRSKNNPVIIGEPGVGKTVPASIPQWASWNARRSPALLADRRVWHHELALEVCGFSL
eukprot:3267830-Amphidinium_carterae.1